MKNCCSFILIALLIGCSGEPDLQAIVEIPEHLQDIENLTAYPVDASPTHAIDLQMEQVFGDTDTLFFSRMTDFAVDNIGRVYISDTRADPGVIYAFQPDGSYLGSVGREGSGPGEFRTPRNLQVVGDRLYFYDYAHLRTSIYQIPSLEFLYAYQPEHGPTDSLSELQGTSIREMYVRSNGSYLFGFQGYDVNNRVKFNHYNYYLILDRSGHMLGDVLFRLPGETFYTIRSSEYASHYTYPFLGNTLVDMGPDDELYTTWTQDFLIKKWDAEGNYQSAFYYPFPKEEYIVGSYLDSAYADYPQWRKNAAEVIDFPDTWPLIESMFVDDQNRIWVATADQKRQINTWRVLQNDGELITQFEWSEDYAIEEVKNGYLYSHETEETGLESLVRYRIQLTEL